MTWQDGMYVTYDYDAAGHLLNIKENGGSTALAGTPSSTPAPLVAYAYDDLGRRASKTFFNGQRTDYTYDPASRLTKLNFPRWPHSIDLAYDDASRIRSKTASYDGFVWNHHAAFDRVFADADHQNKLTTSTTVGSGGTTYGYSQLVGSDLIMDGNLTGDGTSAWGYDNQNRLVSASGGVTLGYDGRDRLHSVAQGGVTTRFQYDGDDLIGEYNAAGALQRRYVHGPGEDEPLIWYDSADLLYKRTLLADERGSIIEVAKATPLGSPETLEFNDYDEYGLNKPGVQLSRFGYTGQAWIPQLGLYYYKARFYDPALGRFMQTDPSRLGDGMNMYAYVGGDPINRSDPSGMWGCDTDWGITDWLCEVGNKLFGGGVKCSGNCSAPFDSPDYRLSTSGGGGGGGGGLASVIVANGGSLPTHDYGLTMPTACNPREAFEGIKSPVMSAPLAPAAQTSPDVVLAGENHISQIVDEGAMKVENRTLEDHWFYDGTVTWGVSKTRYGSSISLSGQGTSRNRALWAANYAIGVPFFGLAATIIQKGCSPETDALLP